MRHGDTGGSAKRQSGLGRAPSVRGGAMCARPRRAPLPRTDRPPKAETKRRPNLAIRRPAPSRSSLTAPAGSTTPLDLLI